MKRYVLQDPAFISGALLATGSIVLESELPVGPDPDNPDKMIRSAPPKSAVQVDEHGKPVRKADRDAGVSGVVEDIPIAPVAPHAPNPTAPQGLPPHNVGEVEPAGNFVGAEGVESDADAAARDKQNAAKKGK